jgi:hypothetical protein
VYDVGAFAPVGALQVTVIWPLPLVATTDVGEPGAAEIAPFEPTPSVPMYDIEYIPVTPYWMVCPLRVYEPGIPSVIVPRFAEVSQFTITINVTGTFGSLGS